MPSRNLRCLLRFFASTILLSATSLAAFGQGITGGVNGEPVIATGSTSGTSSGSYIDAFVATGGTGGISDMCSRIQTAWGLVATNSGTIDARGFTGTAWVCDTSPFSSAKHGVLLLGNVQIPTSLTWKIPTRVRVEGMGSGGAQGSPVAYNTILYAAATFVPTAASPAVVQLGDNSGNKSYQAQISNLTIDCKSISGCVGLLNESAQEASYAQNIIVFNAPAFGVRLTTSSTFVDGTPGVSGGAGNSGPYRNISIQYTSGACAPCSATTVGLQVDGDNTAQVLRGLDNFTVSGAGITVLNTSAKGVYIKGASTMLTNSHVEWYQTGIQIGDGTNATNNVEISNVEVFISPVATGWDIQISQNVGDVFLSGIAGNTTSSQVLNDLVTGNKIVGLFLGFYALGDGTNPAVISSAAKVSSGTNLKWVAPGDLRVVGALTKGSGTFEIDDPRDPANRNLYHSFVESPDMMNVYNGTVRTDGHGNATVVLPDYFEVLNRDFRYQLTVLGSFARATVARKIANNRFVIASNRPGVEVSWQVTGIRKDPFANAHPVIVEKQKSPTERGKYLHPDLIEK